MQTTIRHPLMWISFFALVVLAIEVLLSGGIPRDQLEAVYWAREGVSVSGKHPTFSGVIHYVWMLIFGNSALSGHGIPIANAMVSVALLIILMRRLAFENHQIAMALWLGFASFNTYLLLIKYNANSATLPFWIIGMIGLWDGVTKNRLAGWCIAGLAVGFGFLTKYHTLIWLAAAFFWLLSGKEERKVWRTAGPWVALVIFGVIAAYHLQELSRWGWPTLKYGSDNLSESTSGVGHIVNPSKYILTQFIFAGPGLIAAIWVLRPLEAAKRMDIRQRFLFFFGVLFPILPAAIAVFTGSQLGSIWGIGTAILTVPFLLGRYGYAGDIVAQQTPKIAKWVFGALIVILLVAQPFREPEYPIKAAIAAVSKELSEKEKSEISYVLGTSREAQGATWYMPSRPRLISTGWDGSPWITSDISDGDLILTEGAPQLPAGITMTPERSFEINIPEVDSFLSRSRSYSAHWYIMRVSRDET